MNKGNRLENDKSIEKMELNDLEGTKQIECHDKNNENEKHSDIGDSKQVKCHVQEDTLDSPEQKQKRFKSNEEGITIEENQRKDNSSEALITNKNTIDQNQTRDFILKDEKENSSHSSHDDNTNSSESSDDEKGNRKIIKQNQESTESKKTDTSSLLGEADPKALNFLKTEHIATEDEPIKADPKKQPINIFSKLGPQKKKEESSFLQTIPNKQETNSQKVEVPSKEWKANGKLSYSEDDEWICMGDGEVVVKDNKFIFVRAGLKTVILNFPLEQATFNNSDGHLCFSAAGKKSTINSYEVVQRDYQVKFTKDANLDLFLNKVKANRNYK